MTALQLLPRVWAAMNEMMTEGPYIVGEVFTSIYINGGLHRVWPIVSTVGADEDCERTGVALCILPHEDFSTHKISTVASNAQGIAALRNVLELMIDLVQDWCEWIDVASDQLKEEAETLAQRILDAIRTGMGDATYDAMVAKITATQGEIDGG
jgi:hypothetical protein